MRLLCRFESPCNFTSQVLSDNNSNHQSANIINCEVTIPIILNVDPIIDEHSNLLLLARLRLKSHLRDEHALQITRSDFTDHLLKVNRIECFAIFLR